MHNVDKLEGWSRYRQLATHKLIWFCRFHTSAANCRRWPTCRVGQLQRFHFILFCFCRRLSVLLLKTPVLLLGFGPQLALLVILCRQHFTRHSRRFLKFDLGAPLLKLDGSELTRFTSTSFFLVCCVHSILSACYVRTLNELHIPLESLFEAVALLVVFHILA